MTDWLKSLHTNTPQEGFELAITLARKGVAYTQTSAEVRDKLRPEYAENADSLTAASQVVATLFQTVAAANNYWIYPCIFHKIASSLHSLKTKAISFSKNNIALF